MGIRRNRNRGKRRTPSKCAFSHSMFVLACGWACPINLYRSLRYRSIRGRRASRGRVHASHERLVWLQLRRQNVCERVHRPPPKSLQLNLRHARRSATSRSPAEPVPKCSMAPISSFFIKHSSLSLVSCTPCSFSILPQFPRQSVAKGQLCFVPGNNDRSKFH
jgi:hypothetical protein